jgi:two-component system sensor histidine kinase CpxA
MALATSVALLGEGAEGLAMELVRMAGIGLEPGAAEALLWLIVIVLTSLLGSLVISRIIAGPLTRIQPTVESLSRGELCSRIVGADAKRGDEIGSLARSFNKMAGNMSRLFEIERALLRDISHEMRSPLARMKMAMALARRDLANSGKADGSLAQLGKDIGRLELMIGEMLERARLETASQSGLEKELFDFSALVLGSLEAQTPGAANGAKTTFEGPGSAVYLGNAGLIRRAVDNMVKNALQHTAPLSTVAVRLRVSPESLVLDVIDHGPGVPGAQLESIFQPFFRLDSARTNGGDGFGLGLAITRQAAQLHGGQVTAVNVVPQVPAPGRPERSQGLKVTLVLPMCC